MTRYESALYSLAGAVPGIIRECPGSERQRYRALGYSMLMVGTITAWAAHHAARLCGLVDPVAWIPAIAWGVITIMYDRATVLSLAFRSDRDNQGIPLGRLLVVILNALVLSYFAMLAYNEPTTARVRFDQRSETLKRDRQFLEGEYKTADRAAEVSSVSAALKTTRDKLSILPPSVVQMQDRTRVCDQELDGLRVRNSSSRARLRSEMLRLEAAVSSLSDTTRAYEASLRSDMERIRNQLASFDRQEEYKAQDCAARSRQAREAHRAYVEPLRAEETEQRKRLVEREKALGEAQGKLAHSISESEQVSARAFGFNLPAETNATLILLKNSTFDVAVALVIFLMSVCLETLPIQIKLRARKGPYDVRVEAEEVAFETVTRYRFSAQEIEASVAAETTAALTPVIMDLARPLQQFSLLEREVAKARVIKEDAVDADPERIEEIESGFRTAAAKARQNLQNALDAVVPMKPHQSGDAERREKRSAGSR